VRDLFHFQLPIREDRLFFGRTGLVAQFIDTFRRTQNIGLFGLRKTGKTSLMFRVKRAIENDVTSKCLYYDCKLPEIRRLSWMVFLNLLVEDLAETFAVRRPSSKKGITRRLKSVLDQLPENGRAIVFFDEIEYISPVARLDPHWREQFLEFWQSLWSLQSDTNKIAFCVAGVNPWVVENPVVHGVQNPMFGIVHSTYLRGFELDETRNVITSFGRRMGLRFANDAVEYIHTQYGGHPLLCRMACSFIHRDAASRGVRRPIDVARSELAAQDDLRNQDLTFYCRHIVSELKEFYPDEYQLLEWLAEGRVVEFSEFERAGEYTQHLKGYGIVKVDKVGGASFAIPVLQRYVADDSARREKRATRNYVVEQEKRDDWVRARILGMHPLSEMVNG